MEKKLIYSTVDNYPTREEYKEYCESYEIDFSKTTDEDYFDWADDIDDSNSTFFFDVIRHEELDKNPVIVFGTLGLWNGRKEIMPKVFENLDAAMVAMLQDAVEYEMFMLSDQTFQVRVSHHDGTNIFNFHFLKEEYRWTDPSELDLEDEEIYESVPEDCL